MPSPRRLRLLMLATLVTVVVVLFYLSKLEDKSDTRSFQDFYHKTMNGMGKAGAPGAPPPPPPPHQAVLDTQGGEKAAGADGTNSGGSASTRERLKAAEDMAKAKANGKALRPDPPNRIVGVGNSAEGQAKKAGPDAPKPDIAETEEEHAVEQELQTILRQAPVVIFSKTYCPHSKHAKKVLLEKYSIKPRPFIVELDEHPLGAPLQKLLGQLHFKAKTPRKTVPNIIINGVSIGGNDEVTKLDESGQLVAKLLEFGNKRVEVTGPSTSDLKP